MGGVGQGGSRNTREEEFEVLDVRGSARSGMSWLQRFFQDLTKEPVPKQVAVGGFSGWVVGYLSMKVGKVAATVVGGGMLIMQLAAHKGYIKVDWNRVNKDLERNAKKLKREVESSVNPGVANEDVMRGTARKIDKKLEKAATKLERKINKVEQKAESWVSKQLNAANGLYRKHVMGDSSQVTVDELYLLNMYIMAFAAGTMLGVGTAKII